MSAEASKSAGIVEDCWMAKVLVSVGTSQAGPVAVAGNGSARVASPNATANGRSTSDIRRGSAKYSARAAPLLRTWTVAVTGVPDGTLPVGRPLDFTSTELYRRCPVNNWFTRVPLTGLLMLMNSVHRPAAGART